jgi:hypothetical protein
MTNGRSTKSATRAVCLVLLMAALAGCTPAPPPAQSGTPDEAVQGHAQWCGTNPSSGYCTIDDKR